MSDNVQPESPLARAARFGKLGGGKKEGETLSQAVRPSPTVSVTQNGIRAKTTVYLTPSLLKWTRHQAIDQDKELSEIVEAALQQYKDSLES